MSVEIPGFVAGTWAIDPVHSEVSFVVRHMMVSKVRGRFDKFEGTIVTTEDPLARSTPARSSATRTSAARTSSRSRSTRR
jgi:polyisoprenoid-binding protein YceI